MARRIKHAVHNHHHRIIPDDIIFEILPKLPVKSLLRFTTVSKSWNSVITSPNFIAAHNNHQINNNNNNKNQDHHLLYIWNPCVGTLKTLPLSPSEKTLRDFEFEFSLGFGFARSSNDYRVVKLKYRGGLLCEQVDMYSLGLDLWTSSSIIEYNKDNPKVKPRGRSGVFFQGSIYWLEKRSRSRIPLLLRFDLDEEIFEEIEAPPVSDWRKCELLVDSVNGFLVYLEVNDGLGCVSVRRWVKKTKEESLWINESFFLRKPKDLDPSVVELSKSGHLVFESSSNDGRLFAYDHCKEGGYREIKNILNLKPSLLRVRETFVLLDEKPKIGCMNID